MRPIDADALEKDYREDFERVYKYTRDAVNPADFYIERKAAYDKELVRMEMEAFCKYLQSRPTIDAVPVVHYKDTNTTVLNVKSIEDWQDRIILDEGEESRSCAVYYADSDDMVRVVRCKDCRYSEPMKKHGVYRFGESSLNCTQCRGDDGYGYAGISVVQPDDYCSDGALKDEEETTK